jgi:surface protein
MDVQKGEISLKLINNTSYPQIANILGSVPNLLSPNKNTNLYVFDLSTEDYASLSGISIGISNTSNPTVVNYNLTLLSNDIQGVVQALNTLNMGVFQYYGTSVYVSSGFYIYGALNVNSTSVSFVSLWNTANTSGGSSASNQIKLPLEPTGTYNFIVDWGDGNVDTITTWNQAETLHTYASSGTYTITIDGTLNGWSFNSLGDILKILSIQSWGALGLGNNVFADSGDFYGCANLDLSSVSGILDLSGITNLSQLFMGCTSLTTINNINSWDLSSVDNVSYMFSGCTNFNQNLNELDVSGVSIMNYMFQNANSFNGNISSWDVSSVTEMISMFGGATDFNQDISSWNVSSVTITSGMFTNATLFNGNISSWDVSSVTDMASMFYFANAFNQDISSWNVGLVTNMNTMFASAIAFNQPIGSWNVSSVTDMASMFENATAFNQDIGLWNITSVLTFIGFMQLKTSADYSIANLNSIYDNWGLQSVQPNITIDFGTIKYSGAGASGKLLLTSPPNNWIITDGGI